MTQKTSAQNNQSKTDKASQTDKTTRLAAKLRENLVKRKAQMQNKKHQEDKD